MLFTKVNSRRRNQRSFPVHFDNLIKDVMNTSFGDLIDEKFVNSRLAVNVIENEDGYKLEIAIPGLNKTDINLNVEKEILTISAEKKEEAKETTDKYTRREFNYSTFKRSFHLNETIDGKAIQANYESGILTVSLPKKAEVKAEETKRTIEIG